MISEAFTSLLKAAVESGDSKKAEIAGNMSRSVSQNISQLYRRTQTVQLYRDSVFALCQSAINGTMAIADGTRANIKPDTLQKIRENEKISQWLEEKSKNDPLVKGLLENEPFSSDVLRKFDEIPFDFKKKEKSEVKAIKKKLAMGLKMAEFKRRLVDGLKEAFDRLEEELPMFYETEKLRFLTELGKPIQVCETETTSEQKAGDTEFVETKKVVTCKTKFPENFDQVIKEYLDSSTPEKK
uniref:Uncharacterized protein n=1 Tax=Candidatus Kentrum eta TaxID=2126337 RepID=A0A450UXI5_9GAMM|nr:MAG: hypothetical protein BECKH772A_GA0070896_1001227 [Candidatus Kentron sp. H]VFJ89742.1 MAG: hypothetical protein BECKH772B_GA0070898_1000631 [Candidatus Kentron sp. H]VFJ97221.1 MAG: hypothetical protein BECKH772C_GA0070978_1001127 [Candidatus Kentron sp. H]